MTEIVLEMIQVTEASTGHVTQQDNKLLGEAGDTECPLVVYEYEYGYFIYCGEKDEIEDLCKAAEMYGFSEDLVNLVRATCMQNAKYLQLDGEGREYGGLPVHEW